MSATGMPSTREVSTLNERLLEGGGERTSSRSAEPFQVSLPSADPYPFHFFHSLVFFVFAHYSRRTLGTSPTWPTNSSHTPAINHPGPWVASSVEAVRPTHYYDLDHPVPGILSGLYGGEFRFLACSWENRWRRNKFAKGKWSTAVLGDCSWKP